MGTRNRKNAAAAALCTGVIGNVIWGSSYLFTRIAQNESSPMVQLAWRFALAFLLLNLMILFGWEKLHLRGKKLKPLILLSVVEPLYFFCESYGIYYSNSTFSGVMLAIVPIIAIGLGTLILKEYPTAKQVLLSASHCRCGFGDHCGLQDGGRAASRSAVGAGCVPVRCVLSGLQQGGGCGVHSL